MIHPVILPFVENHDLTSQAVEDVLNQTLPGHLLLVNNGPTAYLAPAGVGQWHHSPSLPSLAATWNRGLQWAWDCGAEHCLVVNNDVRLPRDLYRALLTVQQRTDAWFVTAVNTGEAWKDRCLEEGIPVTEGLCASRGGPDFSCFLITKACHARYPFDEGFIPAYCEDLDYHRRLMLGGDGGKIFSVCVPYRHYGSGTLKQLNPDQRQQLEGRISQARAYYARKWGGPPNEETFLAPFDVAAEVTDGTARTDYLFSQVSHAQAV